MRYEKGEYVWIEDKGNHFLVVNGFALGNIFSVQNPSGEEEFKCHSSIPPKFGQTRFGAQFDSLEVAKFYTVLAVRKSLHMFLTAHN